MYKTKFLTTVCTGLVVLLPVKFAMAGEILTKSEVRNTLSFLTTNINTDPEGVAYLASTTGSGLRNSLLPLSYYSTPAFWEFICAQGNRHCDVKDFYDDKTYSIAVVEGTDPFQTQAASFQVERVNVANGINIYDAACWQIALALGEKNGINIRPQSRSLFDLANDQNKLLAAGYDGDTDCSKGGGCSFSDNRAFTRDDMTTYNYHGYIFGQQLATHTYFYRMLTRNWLSTDPFINIVDSKGVNKYITMINDLPKDPLYKIGKLSYTDWKPITGENAWAFFIGPIQADYLQAITNKKTFIPFTNLSIQNATQVLPSFRAMQSPMGGVFYAAPGSLGNVGKDPVNPYEISVENNVSALAGVYMLSEALADELKNDPSLSMDMKLEIVGYINEIYTMIYGGNMPISIPADNREFIATNGLLSFFKNFAWSTSNGEFSQGGTTDMTGMVFVPPTSTPPKAVDVNTWGIAALGQPLVDKWFGKNAAFNAWQNVKQWGAFVDPRNGKLLGVGFSNQFTGSSPEGVDPVCHPSEVNDVISAEWTAGAITMAEVMSNELKNPEERASVQQDILDMEDGFSRLRSDTYSTQRAVFGDAIPAGYDQLIPMSKNKLAYLYANRRCFIPFGWKANPLPSTTSTAWAIMLNYRFNPFVLGGSYAKRNDFRWGDLTQDVTVKFVNKIADAEMVVATLIDGQTGVRQEQKLDLSKEPEKVFVAPKGTSKIIITFQKQGTWSLGCTINNPEKLTAYNNLFGNNNVELQATWTSAGKGASQGELECQVMGTLS